jgi:hypothetical protein
MCLACSQTVDAGKFCKNCRNEPASYKVLAERLLNESQSLQLVITGILDGSTKSGEKI